MTVTAIYAVFTNTDPVEGRGQLTHLSALFTVKETAEQYAKQRGSEMGGARVQKMYGYDNIADMKKYEAELYDEQLKERALNKLSLEERRVLGL